MNNCIFCKIIERKAPAYIVYEDKDTIAFLDKYPQTRGHLQLAPKTHVRWLYDIENIGSFFVTAQKIVRGIIPVLGADYVRLATYGAEVPHGHLWIVPQYRRAVQLKEGGGKEVGAESQQELAQILKDALSSKIKVQSSK